MSWDQDFGEITIIMEDIYYYNKIKFLTFNLSLKTILVKPNMCKF